MHKWRRDVRNKMVMEATRGVRTAADVEDFELMDFEKAQKIRTQMSSTIQVIIIITLHSVHFTPLTFRCA